MTREDVVSKYHRKYLKGLDVQSIVEEDLENVSFDRYRDVSLGDMVEIGPPSPEQTGHPTQV